MSRIVIQKFPSVKIEGDVYPPPAWRSFIAKLLQSLKFALIIMTVSGFDPFTYLGMVTPGFYTYALQNKVSFCLMTFFVGNLVEGQLLSTGAFEIYLNDMPIWSKLNSDRIPQADELLHIIATHLNLKVDTMKTGPTNPTLS